jgi:hypothetical protein
MPQTEPHWGIAPLCPSHPDVNRFVHHHWENPTMRNSTHHVTLAILSAAAMMVTAAAAAAADDVFSTTADATTISVADGGRPVLSYRFGEVPFKPCVDKLFTPGGVQILRDAPHDHLHHHALMFALVVDGVDFWGERPECGRQLGPPPSITTRKDADGVHLTLAGQLDWTAPDAQQPLAVEKRTIELCSGEGPSATLVTWRSELAPGPGRDAITLSGTHYDGLGVRMIESMDGVGRFTFASGEPGPVVRGTERVTPTTWVAYTAPADGKTVTVALFDHPKNARHPAGMFTMLAPFAYLSATPNVWKEPLEVKAGRPLVLRYGVALWDGEPGRAAIEALYQKWLESEP